MSELKSKIAIFLIVIAVLSFSFGYFVLGWSEPNTSPPSSNVEPPINTGSVGQKKSGKLGVATDGIDPSYGLTVGNTSNLLGIKASGDSYFESSLKIGNFRLEPVSASQLGVYDSAGNLMLILE
jgi:hypothetical protein